MLATAFPASMAWARFCFGEDSCEDRTCMLGCGGNAASTPAPKQAMHSNYSGALLISEFGLGLGLALGCVGEVGNSW